MPNSAATNNVSVEEIQPNQFVLSGRIDMQSSRSLLTQLTARANASDALTLDLQNIDSADSSCIALFLELLRDPQAGSHLILKHPPEVVVTLANLYGVDAILSS